jgi:hypothetical protein
MTPRRPHSATTTPRPRLPQARLLLGAGAAAVGLFVAVHWIVLPGDHLSLDQKNRRLESVAALDPATRVGSRPNAAADRVAGAGPVAHRAVPVRTRSGQATKTAPRTAGKPVGASPGGKQPGAPAGDPTSSGEGSPTATERPAGQSSHSPPPPPPSPPPPPAGLPQLPDLPQVPQVPVPSVPDVPKPQVPAVPTSQVPTLP